MDVVQVRLPLSSASARTARGAAADALAALGRTDLADDVALVVTELVANAVMHARTEMSLSVDVAGDGVRVAVTDGSDTLPRWTLTSATATSGRGLVLVQQLSRQWGVDPLPGGGKCVWAEVDASYVEADAGTPDDLLELWSDAQGDAAASPEDGVDVTIDVDVQAMLASRAHTDDLVRDLQLTLLDAASPGQAPGGAPGQVLGLARRLDAANEEFQEARRQIYTQTVRAARHRQARATLRLRLVRSDVAPAARWLEALDEADALTTAGTLLLPPFPAHLTAFRRQYIGAIIQQLEAGT